MTQLLCAQVLHASVRVRVLCVCVFVWRQNQVVACDEDPGCDEGPLVGGFSGECFRCLMGSDAESGPPPIEPCLTGGVQNLNNASSGRRLQLTGQLSVGKVGGARAVASLSDIANSSARRLQSDTACQVTTVIDEWSYLGGDIVFADGYDHYADCRWLLDGSSRGGNSRIALRFTSFDTGTVVLTPAVHPSVLPMTPYADQNLPSLLLLPPPLTADR